MCILQFEHKKDIAKNVLCFAKVKQINLQSKEGSGAIDDGACDLNNAYYRKCTNQNSLEQLGDDRNRPVLHVVFIVHWRLTGDLVFSDFQLKLS